MIPQDAVAGYARSDEICDKKSAQFGLDICREHKKTVRLFETARSLLLFRPKDMVNILPEEVWNKDTTFLDPCCKSGVFLHEIYLKLMETSSMVQEFPDQSERRKHILQNQLYGISPNGMCQLMSTRTVYGTIQGENNIISFENNYLAVMQNTDKTFLYERLKKSLTQ